MASVGGLGSLLWPMLAVLGRFGPYVGGLGPPLGPMFAVIGPLGSYVGSLRPLLGPMLAVLGRSWGLCWRSWASLGPYVDGLGSLLENAKNMATLKMCLFLERERDLRPGGRS